MRFPPPPRPAAEIGHFVCEGPGEVEEHIVEEEEGPGADCEDAEEELWGGVSRGGVIGERSGGGTKKRMSQVSMMVRWAGRRENQDILFWVGGGGLER